MKLVPVVIGRQTGGLLIALRLKRDGCDSRIDKILLPPRNQRLLAFSADWYEVAEGEKIFTAGDKADAVYLCISGRASLLRYTNTGEAQAVTVVEPGRVIGDLSVLINEERQFDMIADEDTMFLRLGAREYLSVLRNDAEVSFTLLRQIGSYFSVMANRLNEAGTEIPSQEEQQRIQAQIEQRLNQSP